MSNQSIINPDNSKSHLDGIIDVTKLKSNTDPSLVQTSFIGKVNKYDRNFVMAANDPMGPKTREQNRLINQPTSEAFINAGIQAASEIGLGTLEGAGFLLDIPQWVNTIKGTERDFGNWFSDSINELKKEVAEDNPIYAAEGYHPTNAKWWASMIPSVATSVSLMVPSIGGAKLMSTVGKLSTKLAKGIASNSKSANLLAKGLEKSGAALQNYTGVSAAVFSRMAEGTLEATEAGTQAYQKYMEEGMSMEEATEKAGQASAATFLGNMPLLALDLLQYNSIFKQFGTRVGIQAAENALDLSTKSLARRTLQKAWNTVKVPLGEGAEEGLQFGVKEESIKMAADGMPENRVDILMKQYSDIAKNVLPEYFNNDEFLTSITLGAVGGKVFDAITPAVRRLAKMDNTVDEDLRSGKLLAPYYKTRKAFVDLLQQDEVKANEMLEAAKTDPKLNKLGELDSFNNLLTTYNDLKVDPLITKNANSDLIIKERMNELIYSDLKEQLATKEGSLSMPEGIDVLDLKIDALTQLESYEMQTPSKNLRNIQEIRKRKTAYIAEKTKNEIDGTKTTYKPKEGYSWGSRSHRAAINHYANMELADIMASIASSKVIAYESENGSMYAGMDRKIQERLEKIEDLELLRGSEDFDTDEKYINFLQEVQNDRPDLTDEINLILDNLYKENIYDETHPINTLATNSVYKDEAKKNINQLFPIYEANKASALLTREDPSKLRFRNLFSNGISSNQLVTGDKLKYNITPTTGTLIKFDNDEYVLYKVEDNIGFFMSLKDSSDTFKLETSKIKPTDIITTFRKVTDPETNKPLIILPDRAIVVGEGLVVYDRTNIENIVKHDMLAELSNPEVYKIESNRRKELEKADIKIPAIKTIGSAVNLTPFTLGNKNKATRKEAARKLGLKERELVKLSYYEKGSTTLHSIPFMLINGELIDTSNQFYDPEFDRRVFVKAQKYESQIDINNKIYNEINDRYNNKYLELMDDGTLTVTQVTELLKGKNVKPDLYKKINELASLKFRIRSPEDITKILEIISNKGIDIRRRNQLGVDGSIIENGNYEIDGEKFRSTTSLKQSISNSKYPESAPKDKYIKPGNTIDSLHREIFGTTELNRTSLIKKYKDLFSDETVLNDAITVIAKRKDYLEKKGFTFISEGVVLFSRQTKKNIAGETDLIAYDRLGNIHIMDVKTFDEKTYKDYNNEKTEESLSKKDGYRVQLSAYADMFEDRTDFKVSGISVIPYILERSEEGIITGIKTKLTDSPIESMKVISDIHPLNYRGKIYNSAFEVLEITNKTEGIITPKNINKIFKAKLDHFKKEVLQSNVDKQFTVTDFVAYYKDIIDFYNDNRGLLKEVKESDIKEMATLYSNIQTARGLEGVSDIVITGKQITNNLKTEIDNKQKAIFLSKINKGFFTILDNKIYYLNNNYLRYKSAKEVDYVNDFYVIKSGNSYYKANEESYRELDKVYENLINDNVSAEELVVAQQLGFEKISDEDFIPSEMYGYYSIKELVDNTLRLIDFNLNEVNEAKENDTSVEVITIANAIDNNIKELTLDKLKEKVTDIESKIENLKSLDGDSLSIEKLQAYIIDENEANLLDNAEKLKQFYQDKLEYYQGQKDYYEQMFNNETESIPKQDIIEKLNFINREISILEQLINSLLELINKVIDVIRNTENLNRNKATLKEKQNIKSYLNELIPLLTNATEQPEITDTDIQELKDLGVVKKGVKRDITNLKTKGSFRKLKNKYIGSIVYVSPGINVDKFINDIGSEDIIYLDYDKYNREDVQRLIENKDPNKILIVSNPKLYSIVDNFIILSDPKSDENPKNANAHTLENKTIYESLLNDEEFVRKVEFINYGDDLTNFMTEGITPLSDDEISTAESKYSFQYSGLIDSDITYNPYKDSTLVVRGDYFGAESVDEAIYGSFYPRIAIDDDGLNNIIGNLMDKGVVTLDGETLSTNYTRSQFEELYTNKAKKDLFKKSATILLHKSEKGNLNIVLAYKDTSQDIPQYIPVGLMNTLEQSIYAYTTENDDIKPRARKNIMMSNFIRNEIESIASNVDLSSGKLVEIDYDRVKFLDARTTGLNVTKDYEAVSERINSKTQRPTVYVINKKEIIAQKNLTNEENDILNEYNTDVYRDKFRVFYKTSDKLGKTVILPATLKKYNDAPKEYKEGLKNKINELIGLAESSSIVEGVYLNESKLKGVIDEILNNYTNFTYNTPTDFVNGIKGYDDFINKYNINDKNMVINFEDLVSKRDYREKLMSEYLITNVDRDPYVNVQYVFGTTPSKPITGDFDEAIKEEPLIAEGLFYEETDRVYTSRFLILDDDVKKSIRKPLNYETYYRSQSTEVPQFVSEITNKFQDKSDVSYTESFNEFVRSLSSINDLDKYNVIAHILKNTNNSTIKNLRKEYLSDTEFINDAMYNSERIKDFSVLYNYIEDLKIELNTNNKLIREFYSKVDDAYFLDNEPELDPVTLDDASRALLALAIQEKKLDFDDPNKLISIIKGSTEKNFFLNELVLLLLEKTNAANLTTVVKLVKSLRPDIQTIELTEENEFVLVKNTKVKPDSGKLYSTILKGLKVYGYNVDIETESYSHEDSEDISIVEEEKDSKEAWSIVKTFQFPTTTLNKNTKILLQSIISDEKDNLGLNINLNYKLSTAYAMTVDKLVNSKNVDDLKYNMGLYSKSIEYIKRLKSYIDNSENADELYGQLYVAIGNKIRVTYKTVIKDKKQSIYPVLSNRQSAENIISTMLNAGIKAKTEYKYKDIVNALMLSNKEKIDLSKIKEFETILNQILLRYDKNLEIYNSLSDNDFYKRYNYGKNTYTFDTRDKGLDNEKYRFTTKELVRELVKYIPKSSNAVHMTVEKTMQYQDTTGNFIGYVQNNTEEHFDKLRKDPLFKKLPVLNRDDRFEVIQVIGYDDQYNDKGTTIGKLDKKLAAEMLLSMHKENSYPVPVPGDSGNMVFVNNVVPIGKNIDIDKELYNLMLFEKDRIESIGNRDRDVKSYRKNGSEYVIFKAIDKILKEDKLEFNEFNVKKAFDKYFEESSNDFIKYLTSLDIIDNEGLLKSKIQGYAKPFIKPALNLTPKERTDFLNKVKADNILHTKKEINNFLKRFTASYVNITLLTINDPSYYPRIEEVFKRAKQNISPGIDMDMTASYTNPKNTADKVILKDDTEMKITILNDVDDFFTQDPQYREIEQALLSIRKQDVLSQFDGTSETDAQAYIDPIAYRQRMVGLRDWTDADQLIMDELMIGNSIVGYNVANNKVSTDSRFTTIKPFYFYNGSGIKREDNKSFYNEPFQIKDSEMLITPYYGLQKLKNEKGEFIDNPNYNAFYRHILQNKFGYEFNDTTHTVKYVENKRISDLVVFNTAVKVGLPISDKTEDPSTDITDDRNNMYAPVDSNMKGHTITVPFRFWKKQNETPKGHFSKESIYGTQLMKLIMADIPDDATFNIAGKVTTKDAIINMYNEILVKDVNISLKELKEKYGDGKEFDVEKFVKVLQEEMSEDTINMQKALEFTYDEDGNLITSLPLAHPFVTNRVQPKTNAIFKNNVTVRKFLKGFKAANASSYGFKNKPRIVWNVDKNGIETPALGIDHFEIIAPIHKISILCLKLRL